MGPKMEFTQIFLQVETNEIPYSRKLLRPITFALFVIFLTFAKIKFAKIVNNTVQNGRIIKFAKINSVKMIFGWIRKSLLPRKFPAILYACPQNLVGMASWVNSPWSSKILIDWNWLKKFIQVDVDETCMCAYFGGCRFSGFGDIATFKNDQIFLSDHGL